MPIVRSVSAISISTTELPNQEVAGVALKTQSV